jgi:hypothetical protein
MTTIVGLVLKCLEEKLRRQEENDEWCDKLHRAMLTSGRRTTDDGVNNSALPGRTFVYTTNVDSMFNRCQFRSVYNVHGRYETWQCSGRALDTTSWRKFEKPCSEETWLLPKSLTDNDNDQRQLRQCRHCQQRPSRPAVYMFGDTLHCEERLERAQWTCFADALATLARDNNDQMRVVLLEIGVGTRLPKIRKTFGELSAQLGDKATHIR